MTQRFLKWDYDNGVVIEYARAGDCNGCGACCETRITFDYLTPKGEAPTPNAGSETTNQQGVWAEYNDGESRRFFKFHEIPRSAEYHRCPAFSLHKKRCTTYVQRGLICSGFPFIPENVERFAECSYQFSEIGRWTIDQDRQRG